MRVPVTGADGFVGRHLCPHLVACGDDVVPLTLPVDITNPIAVRNAVEAARAEAVIHLAGFASVGQSHRDPSGAFAVNAIGAGNLLAAVQQLSPKGRGLRSGPPG